MCESEGKKNGCCHCWSSDGKPKSYEDDCHEPPNCLAYSVEDSGHFKFGALQGHDSLEHVLTEWGPSLSPTLLDHYSNKAFHRQVALLRP